MKPNQYFDPQPRVTRQRPETVAGMRVPGSGSVKPAPGSISDRSAVRLGAAVSEHFGMPQTPLIRPVT